MCPVTHSLLLAMFTSEPFHITHPLFAPPDLSDAHTRAHTRAHIQLSIQAGKSSVHYNIYTSQSFLCAQLRLGKIVLQNSAYTLFTLHSLCLFCSPFLCSTTLWTCAGRNLFYAPASLSVCSLTGSLWTGVFWTGRESHLKCLKFKLHTQIKPCQ